MRENLIRRTVGIAAALCITAQSAAQFTPQPMTANALSSYANAVVENCGSANGNAVIKGMNASVEFDGKLGSNVLDLHGDSFGSGWLQLPAGMFGKGCENGFTFSLKFRLDSEAENYTRLFQFSPVAFGAGAAPSYSSPDISVDLKDKKSYRTSIFAGKGSTTENDEKHRAIFDLLTAPDSMEWHELTAVYSPTDAQFYMDGKKLSTSGSDTLSDTMKSLFGEGVLPSYTYNSIGHSVYTDSDIRACVDDIRMYGYALSAAQAAKLPDDELYYFTFEEDTVKEGEALPEEETTAAPDGTPLTGLPSLETVSPDRSLLIKFWTDPRGSYYYSVYKQSAGRSSMVIEPSKLGLVTTSEDLSSGFSQTAPSASFVEHDETYKMPYGKHTTIRDNYTELSFPLRKGNSTLTVYFRAYDDGIGYRYSLDHGATIKEETSQVMFPDKSRFWGNWPNATYEWDMVELPRDRANETNATYSCPYTGVINDKYWVTVTEAGVFNEDEPYCAGALQFVGNYHRLRFKGGVKVSSISMKNAFHTPWRAVVIGDDLDEMASSDLILNLNPPSVIEDTSWIRPGKTAWSWWSSGGDSPVEYHTQKDYIDFAADNGWDFVCLDFGWALWDDSEAKVRELCDYAAAKGIGIYLWYGVNNKGHSGYKDSRGNPAYPYYSLLDEATIVREFERIRGLGVSGVKVDYYESDTQETMKQMNLCARIAAENHLMVLFHGCTIPRGESRTYPNIVSFEAVNGTEYYKWFDAPALANRVSYTFTRNVVGSADFTPTGIPIYGIKATAGFALADVVTIESGIQHFAHSVYTYQGNKALPFLNDVPVAWDDMKVLDGYPMQFNVTARRSGGSWYVGASTLSARNVTVDLSKLIDDDGVYTAYIFGDNKDGNEIEVTVLENLTKDSSIKRDLLANGGFAMKITKSGMRLTTPYSNFKFYEAENAKISGNARITSGKDGKYSSGSAYVGYIGGGADNAVTFENVNVDKAGEYTLRIYYVSGERRNLSVDVNGSKAADLSGLYANRNDWSGIAAADTKVTFKAGNNTVKLYNAGGNGPSIDRIAVAIPYEDVTGDVNLDGEFSVADLVLMQKYLLGAENFNKKQFAAADLNSDGNADIYDMIRFRKMILEKS
ncbi:MAG: glycoside hydrolase family 97 catalytic domain-containing protein [Ruminococcus sp.]|uniref:glycoside hydrolase family 97 catalytic domain-containing protein n=1 Tax=Ruminococcus sp. TaxID=41978 RepID=UPI0025D0818B|nr:glycoside hydrolase family 97 catalytic domain-containing protein [Ruminococcus sp.]MBR5683458.1 glycoside hydrolase family 97 catalytic domain-containing protein [Ruminococcus sp.]